MQEDTKTVQLVSSRAHGISSFWTTLYRTSIYETSHISRLWQFLCLCKEGCLSHSSMIAHLKYFVSVIRATAIYILRTSHDASTRYMQKISITELCCNHAKIATGSFT